MLFQQVTVPLAFAKQEDKSATFSSYFTMPVKLEEEKRQYEPPVLPRLVYGEQIAQVILPNIMKDPTDLEETGLSAAKLFRLVNEYREQIRLPKLILDDKLCKIAKDRLPELPYEIWGAGVMHSGFYNRNLPYYAVENLVAHNTEEEALYWWLNSYIHRITIEGDYKYSCTACKDGNCTQLFTNYEPNVWYL